MFYLIINKDTFYYVVLLVSPSLISVSEVVSPLDSEVSLSPVVSLVLDSESVVDPVLGVEPSKSKEIT